jgi:hypothetical protein
LFDAYVTVFSIDLPGVVLALNARILHCKLSSFDNLLLAYPKIQILAWTGAGEPNIPRQLVEEIDKHFADLGIHDQISFDVSIAS